MRKLASIQKIDKLSSIEGADRINCADILGWHCVVKKEDFKEGDLCVYFEVDSILPDKPCFEFLRDHKFRIKTRKFKGQISQGLAFPIPLIEQSFGFKLPKELGEDVTVLLGVVKTDINFNAIHIFDAKGSFPSFVVKTDEPRIQTIPSILERFKGIICYVTEKIDGTSCTIYRRDGEFSICSRNFDLKEGDNPYWNAVKKYKVKETLEREQLDNIALQGEIYGIGIQKNPLKLEQQELRIFSVFDIKTYKYFDFEDAKKIIVEKLGMSMVPILDENFVLNHSVDQLVQLATRRTSIQPAYAMKQLPWAEGIVIRPLKEMIDLEFAKAMGNGRVSFKVVNPEYLLERGE